MSSAIDFLRNCCQFLMCGGGFLDGSAGRQSTCSAGDTEDMGLIPGSGTTPGGGHSNPFQYSCLENSTGQRSLVGYSSKGRKESDMAEAT